MSQPKRYNPEYPPFIVFSGIIAGDDMTRGITKTHGEFIKEVEIVWKKEYVVLGEYVSSKTKIKVFHKVCENEWDVIPCDFLDKHGCPFCDGKKVSNKNSLSTLFPNISKEWHFEKNFPLTPKDVTVSYQRKVWWLCQKGHEYQSRISNRTSSSSCKRCSDEKQESEIATKLKVWCHEEFGNFCKEEYRIFRNPETNYFLPYDIYIGQENSTDGIYIEINGSQHYKFNIRWHKTIENFEYNRKLDKLKKIFARKNGLYIEINLLKIKTIEQAIILVKKKIAS